jgi:hypothetical protein
MYIDLKADVRFQPEKLNIFAYILLTKQYVRFRVNRCLDLFLS